ncbi:TPA: hypothetical protein UM684_004311 [Stenotrophomonas maltophilia]|uniref:hypothetical protein n=1 Tax=Stenotrophomonas maltophilia TaxID=40324 RepID=UPI001463A5EE|nr:hypothetical protein [Stenotrophomonas maltophilia]MBH1379710.1 hypothetical protein [Stenotrophomonas maltophilia]MBH1395557.1 hypothetical protein [Stenotrophomonas maltophilia]MBH1467938.1 hypothetical protein [Stenotrophomonas maltophilia]MBH1472136.1 hypothetical protein [Stenotrophomonas maltophilia]QJP19920.1 hypothetical protein HKK60_10355 [Stenotrophomonas maltophilia]
MKPVHGVLLLLAAAPSATRADDYSGMLAYLDVARIDGRALAGANGAIAVNQAAGDLNVQANLRGIAKGDRADVATNARQLQQGNRVLSGPLQATAFIGGDALAGASGIASINQASGIANTTLNVVSATLARQGIRETDDTALAAEGSALAGGRDDTGRGVATGTRSAGVASTALRGFDGVLQLNQIAGNGNDTANVLGLVVQDRP